MELAMPRVHLLVDSLNVIKYAGCVGEDRIYELKVRTPKYPELGELIRIEMPGDWMCEAVLGRVTEICQHTRKGFLSFFRRRSVAVQLSPLPKKADST